MGTGTVDSIFDELEREQPYEYATRAQRLVNGFVDTFIYLFVFGIIFIVIDVCEYISNGRHATNIEIPMYFTLAAGLVFILFYGLQEGLTKGRTIGKFITGTMVSREDFSAITFSDAILRSFIRLFPIDIITCFMARPLHDRWSETYLVKKRK